MRKTTKSILSMVLSAAMVLSLASGVTIFDGTKSASAADVAAGTKISKEFNVYLVNNNSKIFTAGEESTVDDIPGVVTSAAISATGEYALGGYSEGDVENLVTEGSYLGLETSLTELPTDFSIVPKEIRVTRYDGTVDTYDWSKALFYPASLKEGQRYRYSIMNNYVTSVKNKEWPYANPFVPNINGTATPSVEMAVETGDYFEVVFEVKAEAPVVVPTPTPTVEPTAPPAAKEYNAYLGFQTDNYIFRNCWNDPDYGINSKDYKYTSQVGISTNSKIKPINATIKDTKMAKNDTQYTISISGVNMKTLKGEEKDAKAATKFNMIYITTDIPLAMKGVAAKNVTLKIDGKVIKTYTTAPCKGDADGYYQLMLANAYGPVDGTKDCPYPSGKELTVLPTSSIEVTFTLSGVNFNQDFSTKTIGTKKGKTFTKGKFKYKVTKVATETAGKKAAGKVTVVGLSKAGKKAKKLSVPAKVTKTGTYKVTAIAAKSFKGAKATSITLSKNIKKLPANAFANCKKLTKLTLKAKLSSVNKKAFKGCKKKIKIAGTSKKANLKKIKKVYKKAK